MSLVLQWWTNFSVLMFAVFIPLWFLFGWGFCFGGCCAGSCCCVEGNTLSIVLCKLVAQIIRGGRGRLKLGLLNLDR